MNGTLTRFAYLEKYTLGYLQFPGLKLATIERPWIPNPKGLGGMPQQSCIPDGQYRIIPHNSEKFPETYCLANELLGVYVAIKPQGQTWGRSAILIHAGNKVADVIGCVAIGMRHAAWDGEHGVGDSKTALGHLRALLGRTNHTLLVQPTPGTVA